MPRARVSAENQALALDFALMVTTSEGATTANFVARHGPYSVFSVLKTVAPGVIRTDSPTSNRKGITEPECLRVLADSGLFRRFRDRKAVKMDADPTGAGMCMFRGIRWRDPADSADSAVMRRECRRLAKKHPSFASTSFKALAATLKRIIPDWEAHLWQLHGTCSEPGLGSREAHKAPGVLTEADGANDTLRTSVSARRRKRGLWNVCATPRAKRQKGADAACEVAWPQQHRAAGKKGPTGGKPLPTTLPRMFWLPAPPLICPAPHFFSCYWQVSGPAPGGGIGTISTSQIPTGKMPPAVMQPPEHTTLLQPRAEAISEGPGGVPQAGATGIFREPAISPCFALSAHPSPDKSAVQTTNLRKPDAPLSSFCARLTEAEAARESDSNLIVRKIDDHDDETEDDDRLWEMSPVDSAHVW